jgi:hypothetical protein
MSDILYAAAPRGVRVESYVVTQGKIVYVDWENRDRTDVFESFREALDDAIEISYDADSAYEVVMVDPHRNLEEMLVGHSSLIASCGVVYEMVDDDELPARIADHEGTLYE